MKNSILVFLMLIGLYCSSYDQVRAQDTHPLTHTSAIIEGRVMNDVGDVIPTAPGEVRPLYPAPNRSVFIFDGIYKDISVDQVAKKVVKTDRMGRFQIRLSPGVYTFAILVNSKYVTGTVRPDGYMPFFDCCSMKQGKVELIDVSKGQ